MSYHILQQFDESLLSEITDTSRASDDSALCEALMKRRENRLISLAAKQPTAREWFLLVVTLVAICGSIFYSVALTKRLNEVQDRLVRLESAAGGQTR